MDTVTCQRPTWLGTQVKTVCGRAVRIPGVRAVAPSRTTPNAQGRARISITDYDLAPSPASVAAGLVLMMATAVAAACSAAYTPPRDMSGTNVHADGAYADGVQHRRLRRVR